MDDLAQRAVACKHWRWLPGMLTSDGARLLFENRVCVLLAQPWAEVEICRHTLDCTGALPDLSDDLTRLGLLALVREAWGDSGAFCECSQVLGEPMWNVYLSSLQYRKQHKWKGTGVGDGDTEAEALVAALEAAP